MAHIPPAVLEKQKLLPGMTLLNQGKVRDTYEIPGHSDKLLVVASDRCSTFDIVLNTIVPHKGHVLTALNHFWCNGILRNMFNTDLLCAGVETGAYLPKDLQGQADLQGRASIVKKYSSPEVEDVVRFILTGTGFKDYRQNGKVCGQRLPGGLGDGDMLPFPLYTPTTKAVVGHDEALDVDEVVAKFGSLRERVAIQAMCLMKDYAAKRGILLGDGKLEMATNTNGHLVLIDEKGTPDACRYFDLAEYERLIKKGKLAPPLDKQYMRNKAKELGIDKLNPKKPEDLATADAIEIDPQVARITGQIYRYIEWRLTGMQLEDYQSSEMYMEVKRAKRKIAVVFGSESDITLEFRNMLSTLKHEADFSLHAISCHRNASFLYDQCTNGVLTNADIVIAGAGMLAALPGIIKAWFSEQENFTPVIGVAVKGGSEKDNLAAKLSMECLPGRPVELDPNGNAYFGVEGFFGAVKAAIRDEFLPKRMEDKKPQLNIKIE